MSETPNIDELRVLSRKLAALIEDPQPGIPTWRTQFAEMAEAICDIWGESKPDYTVARIHIPAEVFEFFSRASGGRGEEAITNALKTLMEMFSV